MACQRNMTHSERERKDGVPKKHDQKEGKILDTRMSKKKKEKSYSHDLMSFK